MNPPVLVNRTSMVWAEQKLSRAALVIGFGYEDQRIVSLGSSKLVI